jgi:hypothetical protein
MSFDPFTRSTGGANDTFDFDYELLDKLLGLEGVDVAAPVPVSDERNGRLGSEWIRQLEQDLEHFIDVSGDAGASGSSREFEEEDSRRSTSPPTGTTTSTLDFFDREWNDISSMLTHNNTHPFLLESSSNESCSSPYNSHLNTPAATSSSPNTIALNINRELQRHVQVILDRSKLLEQQQKDLVRVTDILASQIDKKIKKKFPVLPFLVHEIPSLAALDKIAQEAGNLGTRDPRLDALSSRITQYNKNLKTIPRWTFKERSALAHGIRAQNEKILLAIIQAKGTHSSLEECRKIIESFSETDMLMNVNGIDWEAISKLFVQSRSPTDCRLQWTINDHPMINKTALFEDNQDEIEKLKKIVPRVLKRVGTKGLPEEFCSPWQMIASELGTNRTAIQCFMIYQRKINPNFLKGKWSPHEDEQLMAALKLYGTQNWQAVAQMLDGRTGQQCLHRYEKAINPQIKRGRWSQDEDKKLKEAIEPFLNESRINWSVVKQSVLGRTDVQCRERWVNVLDPSINATPFSPEEDEKLLNLVESFGSGSWARISIEMGHSRTDNQCWRRWKKISKTATASAKNNPKKKNKTSQ